MTRPRTDRFTRIVILVWVVAGIILLTVGFRSLTALGVFSFDAAASPGICRPITVPAPGDLAYEAKSRTLLIASNPAVGAGAIHALAQGQSQPVKLAGTPVDFHPLAISIGYDAGGEPMLAVVDVKSNGARTVGLYSVVFDAQGAKLVYQSTITGGLARRAQAVAALGNGRFYLTSNPTSSDFMAWADRWLLLGRANLLFFNGISFRDTVSGLSDPSGVTASADGQYIYVLSRNERRLFAFSREPFSGTLTELDSIALPMRPERVSMDANNVLWVAGPARLPALGGASRVVRVALGADGKPQGPETIYAGDDIVAASAVAKGENRLFIGSASDGKLLACDVK